MQSTPALAIIAPRYWRAPNLLRIQVDQVTKARPVHFTVRPDQPEHPFTYDRHGAEALKPEGQE